MCDCSKFDNIEDLPFIICCDKKIVFVDSGNNGTNNLDSRIVTETFIYDGLNNIFTLTQEAKKVLNIFIDNGTYPEHVPTGTTTNIILPKEILYTDNRITVQYII